MQKSRTDVLHIVGTNLRLARISKNLSLTELSKLTGIDKGDLSKMEAGKINFGIITLYHLRDSLEIGIEQFFQE
ncbi:helix-turn-helix domain-containing protein [Chitinophaga pollutisoli]|uniref:helix-turn-helix domain-containing protein n=1 Tax=Chitinophaga pollutisoli TaxID=3133966 RepID=UPI003857C655